MNKINKLLLLLLMSAPLFAMELPEGEENCGIKREASGDLTEIVEDEAMPMEEDEQVIHKPTTEIFRDLLPFEDPEIQDLLPGSYSTREENRDIKRKYEDLQELVEDTQAEKKQRVEDEATPMEEEEIIEPISLGTTPFLSHAPEELVYQEPINGEPNTEESSYFLSDNDSEEESTSTELFNDVLPLDDSMPIISLPTNFETLPLKIQLEIIDCWFEAPGFTNKERLLRACQIVRNIPRINKRFRRLCKTQLVTDFFIRRLAERYTNGNKIKAAIVLGTHQAGLWLRNCIRNERDLGLKDIKSNYIYALLEEATAKNEEKHIEFIRKYFPGLSKQFPIDEVPRSQIIASETLVNCAAYCLRALQPIALNLLTFIKKVPGEPKEITLSNVCQAIHESASIHLIKRFSVISFFMMALAADYTNKNIVKAAIIFSLANPEANVDVGQWLADIIQTPEHKEIVTNTFIEAIADGDINIINFLLTYLSFLSSESLATFDGFLVAAAQNGHSAIIDRLLKMPNILALINETGGIELHTPLMAAVIWGYKDIVQKLIKSGADVNIDDEQKMRALTYAAQTKDVEILKILIAAGAVLDHKDEITGETALMMAIYSAHPAAVRALLRAGAGTEIKDNDGETALDYAQRLEEGPIKEEIMQLLRIATAKKADKK